MFCRGLVVETQRKEKFSNGQERAPRDSKDVGPVSWIGKQKGISDVTTPSSLKR